MHNMAYISLILTTNKCQSQLMAGCLQISTLTADAAHFTARQIRTAMISHTGEAKVVGTRWNISYIQ